jgi:HPt (histidine-containing phosphotransfer) domain-containing protein
MMAESHPIDAYFNKEELLTRVMDNHELVDTLLKVYIEDMPKILNNLILAAEQHNSENVVLESHSLKGCSYSLTANQIGDLAQQIETSGKENNLDKVNDLLPILVEQLDLTVDHFKHLLAND